MPQPNNYMDELFRRAAESYPLHTNSADWSKVEAALYGPDDAPLQETKKRNLLWLLLLLPLLFICNRVPVSNNDDVISAQQSNTASPKTASQNSNVFKGKKAEVKEDAFLHSTTEYKLSKDKSLQAETVVPFATVVAYKQKNTPDNIIYEAPPTVTKDELVSMPQEKSFSISGKDRAEEKAPSFSINTTPTVINADSASNAVSSSPKIIEVAKKKRFYLGLMGGPDVSTVKFQRFSKVGFELGLIAGFEITPRISVEAGIFSDRKYYYSNGRYVNTAKVYVPANANLTEATGYCNMIELPLSVRYRFVQKNKHAFFATAGLSSYLMQSENYIYNYFYPSTSRTVAYEKEYTGQTKNWFSVLQFSAGYTHALNKTTDLRLEPYIKLPVSGLGYADLPISSTGARIGVTKKLF